MRSQRSRLEIAVAANLANACRRADIISCKKSLLNPIAFGDWITAGTHVDLFGSHAPNRRECDDEIARLVKIYVDVMETAMREDGDILIPSKGDVITEVQFIGDLSDLTRSVVKGRSSKEEIALVKSTGTSLADMAAAEFAVMNAGPVAENQA